MTDQDNDEDISKADYEASGWFQALKKVKEQLDWTKTPLNVAVTGNSGAGKSSLINALRNMKRGDKRAAKVGVTETTMDMTPYPHPLNHNLVLWDIPGVGTPKWPKDSYLEAIDFQKYDFYIIVSAQRFTDNDLWLAQEITNAGKKFIFVRSKIDIAIMNEEDDHPTGFSEAKTLEKVRKDCLDNLQSQGIENMPVFLLSSKKADRWDFHRALSSLVDDFPEHKKEAIVLTISTKSKKFMRMKKKVLEKRIKELFPSSTDDPFDVAIMFEECQVYAMQFSINEESLVDMAATTGAPLEVLKAKTKAIVFQTADELDSWILKETKNKASKGGLKRIMRSIGDKFRRVDAANSPAKLLQTTLNSYESCAVDVLDEVKKHLKKDI